MKCNMTGTHTFDVKIIWLIILCSIVVLLAGCVGATDAVQSKDGEDVYEFSVNYSLYDIQNVDRMATERIDDIMKTHDYTNFEILEESHPIPGILRKDYKVKFWK